MNDARAERLRQLREAMRIMDPDDLKVLDERDKAVAADKLATIDSIMAELLGVPPDAADATYTQHPLMAGVLRMALRMAFDGGKGAIAKEILGSMFAARAAEAAKEPAKAADK